ncbi:hypothetical protein ACIQZB_00460 [Streptomyces sp. NPDC097727]|uniref:hypothetical protein n=1 Tax=Streptomyces sp. NPDC097727 TaxID=3366092 RepID=UPI0037F8B97E
MTTAQTGASLAGCAIAILILFANLRKWWTGGRALKDLLPTIQGFITGAFGTVCSGGLVGWLAGCTRQGANAGGSKAVSATTGTETGGEIPAASMGSLTEEGAVIVFLLFCALVLAYKAASKEDKGRMTGALVAGFILCATAGVAGALHGLPDLANSIGLSGRNALRGAL